ncbi:MAG TPA: prepilin-type N-terminal cleavage/methylation domain-containing protein [Candidatus Angelobacter sp.]|jgi:prepilin-type N-terminal cleavage/methylation domain-containing protein|nr:prepilin-type N-terminal cleavage/methylation domain-containing protein [Candidatus Angelobacter sp.]
MNRQFRHNTKGVLVQGKESSRGFTIIELLIVVVICLIMAGMAVPLLNTTMTGYRLRGATASVTGSIQATRYQAIFNGYPFRLVLDSTARTYQVQRDQARAGVFTNYCVPAAASCAVPLAGSGTVVALNANTTFTFSPGGTVQSTTAVSGVTTMVLTYGGKTETVTVSSYGNIKVTP